MIWGGQSIRNPIPLINVIMYPQSYGDIQFLIFLMIREG